MILEKFLKLFSEINTRNIKRLLAKEPEGVIELIKSEVKKCNGLFAYQQIASEGYSFMVVVKNPHKLFLQIVDELKKINSSSEKENLNPVNIYTKLAEKEFMLELNENRICYGIQSSVSSNYVLKAIACRHISSATNFYNYVDSKTNQIKNDSIAEIHPLYDYETNAHRVIGAKSNKHKVKSKFNRTSNDRINIITRLIEYVRQSPVVSEGVIFVNRLDECSSAAINILYTDFKYKNAIVDYLKILTTDLYKTYSFKSFHHADFTIPYDFRMVKHSCLLNNKSSGQTMYIANLYNIATYDPIPCHRVFEKNSFIQIVHPIVKLRLLYLDMFMIEHKLKAAHPVNQENAYMSKMLSVYEEMLEYQESINWVGVYVEESYEKNKVNMRARVPLLIETLFI